MHSSLISGRIPSVKDEMGAVSLHADQHYINLPACVSHVINNELSATMKWMRSTATKREVPSSNHDPAKFSEKKKCKFTPSRPCKRCYLLVHLE